MPKQLLERTDTFATIELLHEKLVSGHLLEVRVTQQDLVFVIDAQDVDEAMEVYWHPFAYMNRARFQDSD